ncbi:hypothetical protein NAI75_11140, partial [Francisella tularensis subsp. holarctica]|uniref:hypothetical protein n=1 Tax=Francisella tularensis TaxID=263 RepID=UPI002381B3FF
NSPGAIAKSTATLAREGVDISSFDMISVDNKQAKLSCVLVVRNRRELYLFVILLINLFVFLIIYILLYY